MKINCILICLITFLFYANLPSFSQTIIKEKNAKFFDENHNLYSGRYIEYYEDGTKRIDMNIKNGELDSTTFLYYPNGQVMEKQSYQMGLKHGEWVKYNLQGKIISIAHYYRDKKDGKWLIFDEDGNIRYEMHYREGIKCGVWTSYNVQGEVIETRTFDTCK